MSEERQTLVRKDGSLGHILLDRPKALNSLTLPMIRDIEAALDDFEADPSVRVVLISGAGERGLCAGGDIRMVYEQGKAGSEEPLIFWREEYRLNERLSRYPKPIVAFMDGIVMGGGVGVSVYARHRVVTERTRFAMPETGIGFYPDVGASWFLSRLKVEIGTFIGLTGEALGAGDVIATGLADVFVPLDRLTALADALKTVTDDNAVTAVIEAASEAAPAAMLADHRSDIDRLFAFDTIEDILAALDSDGSAFAEKTLCVLSQKSPTSLKVTLRLLREGRRDGALKACISREFDALSAVLRSHDFYEGVRAAVIDKDRNPQWRPARLEDVTQAEVDAYFAPAARPLFEKEELQ